MKVVIPILIVPGGEASPDDVDAVTAARTTIADWWETRYRSGLLVYITRPVSPPCDWPISKFFPDGWTPVSDAPWSACKEFIQAQYPPEKMLANYGITNPNDLIYLVFLQDFHNPIEGHIDESYTWWGWGGPQAPQSVPLRWAVLDYDLVDNLKEASLQPNSTVGEKAMGAICHELGHCLGWQHTDDPYPNVMLSWTEWPAVNIPTAPIAGVA